MRAFVLSELGEMPTLQDFREPVAIDNSQVVVKVLAAGMNPVEYVMAQGVFGNKVVPRVVGLEGVGKLADGQRVYVGQSVSPFGTFAEYALAKADQNIILPAELENGPAIALGVAGMAAWLPLSWKAKLKAGESVLILGATGVQGQLAVQAAKLLGAGHVVAAGRNREILESLKQKGADKIAVLEGDLTQALKQVAPDGGYQVVVDSLFGEPFNALLGSGTLDARSRVVVLGGSADQQTNLAYRQLQAIQGATISGYSSFNVSAEDKREAYLTMAQCVIEGTLSIDIETYSLDQAAEAWQAQGAGPHRKIVIVP